MNCSTEELIALLRTRDAVSREAAKRLQELHDQILEHGRAITHVAEEMNRAPRRDTDGMPVIVRSLFLPCYCWRHGAPGTAECDCTTPQKRDGYPSTDF